MSTLYAFDYERPTSQAQAIKLLKNGGQALAGGQTLLASMKLHLAAPKTLVDLGAIEDLRVISKERKSLLIGAMARHHDVAASEEVRESIPALAELAGLIGDRQVRNMGTIGGSIANNDPAADYPAALVALDATLVTNKRKIAAEEFFQGLFATALREGELITAVHFPYPERAAYVKFPQPASLFALIGVFVAQFKKEVRVAVTGGGNGVFRQNEMEAALEHDLSGSAIADIRTDASRLSSDLHGNSAYRAQLVNVIARRAVAKLAG